MVYIFALIPPLLDSIINFLDKFLLSKYNVSSMILTIYSGVFAFITGLIIFFFTGLYITDLKTTIVLISSGFCVVLMLVAYFKALSLDEASRVAPLFQFVPVFVLLSSFIFLQETLSLKQYTGCAIIIVAGFLFSVRKFNRNLIKANSAFWYMMLASLLSAFIYILFKTGVREVGFWQAIPYESTGNGLAVVFLLINKKRRKKLAQETKKMSKKVFFYLTISEGIYRLSRFSFYFALLLIPASIVSILQGFQPLFLLIEGIILSIWFPHILKEIVTKKTVGIKLFATMLIFVGLGLIFL